MFILLFNVWLNVCTCSPTLGFFFSKDFIRNMCVLQIKFLCGRICYIWKIFSWWSSYSTMIVTMMKKKEMVFSILNISSAYFRQPQYQNLFNIQNFALVVMPRFMKIHTPQKATIIVRPHPFALVHKATSRWIINSPTLTQGY